MVLPRTSGGPQLLCFMICRIVATVGLSALWLMAFAGAWLYAQGPTFPNGAVEFYVTLALVTYPVCLIFITRWNVQLWRM